MQYDQNLGGPCLEANGVKAELRLSIVVSRCYRSKLREPPQVWRRHQFLCLAGAFFRPGGARPPREVVKAFIDEHGDRFEVAPICRVLQVTPSMYWRHSARQKNPALRCPREQRDEVLAGHIQRVWQDNFQVYGANKIWRQLNREGLRMTRCTVERLMRRQGLCGTLRGKTIRTTR